MAEAGVYLCVVRQDGELPQVVHNSIRKDDDQGRQEAMNLAWDLFQSARGRIPFTVSELHLSPAISDAAEFKRPTLAGLSADDIMEAEEQDAAFREEVLRETQRDMERRFHTLWDDFPEDVRQRALAETAARLRQAEGRIVRSSTPEGKDMAALATVLAPLTPEEQRIAPSKEN